MSVPLCIDLDGTLIKTDSLYESVLLFLKKNPLHFFLILLWLCRGKAHLKHKISQRIVLNPHFLPYTKQLLEYLKEEHLKGRKIILVTAADKKIAEQVAQHINIFSDVIASDGIINIRGSNKRKILQEVVGEKNYDYAGNDYSDLKVWSSARQAIVVNAGPRLIKKANKIADVHKIFPPEQNKFLAFIKAIRVHQYVKNLLIFLPLFASHLFVNRDAVIHSCLAFFIFCLTASSVYLINDLLDLEVDRQHRTKHKRPFAAGDLSIKSGMFITTLFLLLASLISLQLNPEFFLILGFYFVLTTVYSFYLKKEMLVDIFVLAILYTARIIAGMAAIQAEYSEWLISFSIFFFLSLAFIKRYSELYFLKQDNKFAIKGRSYRTDDLIQLSIFGTVSGYVSIVVFAFYINSDKVIMLYRHPAWLWSVCLLLLYWISRMWMLTTRGVMHEDPVVFAIKDKTSIIIVLLIAAIMICASI